MATMKYYNRNTPPTTGSPDGTYYVKRADNPNLIDTYVVSKGIVRKQNNSEEKVIQLENYTKELEYNLLMKSFGLL